jgi:hypothetical protein
MSLFSQSEENLELGHLVCMDSLTFHLILERPDEALKLASEALARIQRSAA